MLFDKDLQAKMNYVSEMCPISIQTQREHYKILNAIITIIKYASKKQLLAFEPNNIIVCTLKLFFYYDEASFNNDNMCDWKRRKKRRLAKECYNSLLEVYIPVKSREVMESVLRMIYHDSLWEFEFVCFEILYNLLQFGLSPSLLIHTMWEKIEDTSVNVEDTRRSIRIIYEILDAQDWPDTYDTVTVIERILHFFYTCITTTKLSDHFVKFSMYKKGLEVCIINMVKHLCNHHLLVIIHHMCSWVIEPGITDENILDFGSTLEYTAYMHEVGLYEQSLTPKVFPLLMKMISSSSKIANLLGNRVIQYLLDRRKNRRNFDTPKIFFENIQFDLNIGPCFKEDKLFCKLHREILHDNLLKEVPCGFTAAALVCLLMNLQDLTLNQSKYDVQVSYHLHAMVIAVMSLLCWIHKAKVFYSYVYKIVMERAQWAPHLNPPIQSQYNFAAHHILWNKPELFFVDWEARYGLWKCFRLREND